MTVFPYTVHTKCYPIDSKTKWSTQ